MWRRYRLVALALAILVCGPGCQQEQPLPTLDFSLIDVNGEPISLSELKGQVVVVDFWGTWCPPCRMGIPSFVKLQELYGDQGFQMVGINFGDEQQTVIKAIENLGINYPCALGTESIQQQIPDLQIFPTTFFIDKTGTVRSMIVGLHDYDELEERVTELLAE